MQNTSRILMIRPMHFAFNAETAVNNSFQMRGDAENLSSKAVREFDALVKALRKTGIEVFVVEDSSEPHTPDAIFPNNWISFHENGVYCLYPMFAPNRRMERKEEVLRLVTGPLHFTMRTDFTDFEKYNLFLEGTGSMVLDRDQRLAYACLSPRTNMEVLEDFCSKMNYEPVVFHAVNSEGQAIYHTNVMMCVADRWVLICLDAIPDSEEREKVENEIRRSGKEIILISTGQMNQFAGNMLQLENKKKEKILVMSEAAWSSLSEGQKNKLQELNNHIVHSPLRNIETNGGGSARCMIAEIHG